VAVRDQADANAGPGATVNLHNLKAVGFSATVIRRPSSSAVDQTPDAAGSNRNSTGNSDCGKF
jgi:hypothetical protein